MKGDVVGLHIRFQYDPGYTLGVSIERLSDGLYYDFSSSGATAGTFTVTPATSIGSLTAETGNLAGRYSVTLVSTPLPVFADGQYCVNIHDLGRANLVIALINATMSQGDDTTLIGGGGVDPWSIALTGSYAEGTAGAVVGQNLDVPVSSRLSASAYQAAPAVKDIVAGVWDELQASHRVAGTFGSLLDVAVSTRSTYSGGPVASVVAPVTVGMNQDKTGYELSAKGIDQILVEPGVNARQALSPILAAVAGTLSGAGTGSIVIKGGNVGTTRILAATDSAGNRTSVSLVLPT